jgi:hypothetical protein
MSCGRTDVTAGRYGTTVPPADRFTATFSTIDPASFALTSTFDIRCEELVGSRSDVILSTYVVCGFLAVVQWLKHYTTSRMVAGSSPDELNEYFDLPNPSSRLSL